MAPVTMVILQEAANSSSLKRKKKSAGHTENKMYTQENV